jgi:hypothetical protein
MNGDACRETRRERWEDAADRQADETTRRGRGECDRDQRATMEPKTTRKMIARKARMRKERGCRDEDGWVWEGRSRSRKEEERGDRMR